MFTLGGAVLIDAAALIIEALEAETIEYLNLVAILDVDAAVGATLATAEGLEGQEELDVHREILEGLLRLYPGSEEVAFIHVPVDPSIGILTIEEDDGVLRSGEPFGWAAADDTLKALAEALDGEYAILKNSGIDFILEDHLVAVALGFDFNLSRAIPAGAREAALMEDHAEIAVAEGDDVGAEFFVGVFALQREIRPGGLDRQVGGGLGRLGRSGLGGVGGLNRSGKEEGEQP